MTDLSTAVKTVTADQLRQMIDHKTSFTLIDVGERPKFTEFHIPSAINIPLNDQFDAAVKTTLVDRNAWIVMYCGEAVRSVSAKAVQRLIALGYTHVQEFAGGKKAWREAAAAAAPPFMGYGRARVADLWND